MPRATIATLAACAHRTRVPELEIVPILKRTGIAWIDDNVFRLSAALAFYTVFSLAPLLIILVAIGGLLFGRDAAEHRLTAQFAQVLGYSAARTVEDILAQSHRPHQGIVAALISVVMLLIGATAVFGELQEALNTIWRVRPLPGRSLANLVRDRFLSFAMVVALGALLLFSLIISALISVAGKYAGRFLPDSLSPLATLTVHSLLSFFATVGIFAVIYKVLPDVKLRWRDVGWGAFGTAMLFSLGRVLIGLYLGSAGIGSAFGAAGSLAVLLAWVYYSSMILYLGAEFTRELALAHNVYPRPNRHAVHIDPPRAHEVAEVASRGDS